jgi:hypothetical protein
LLTDSHAIHTCEEGCPLLPWDIPFYCVRWHGSWSSCINQPLYGACVKQ